MERDMSKTQKTWLGVGLSIAGVLLLIYFAGVYFFSSHFLPGSTVNGQNTSLKTLSEAESLISDNITNRSVTITRKDGTTEKITADTVDLKYDDKGGTESALNSQNGWLWPMAIIENKVIASDTDSSELTYDQDKLTAAVAAVTASADPAADAPQDARVEYDTETKQFVVKAEVEGNQVNTEGLTSAVGDAFKSGSSKIDLESSGLYNKPSVKSDDEGLKKQAETLNTKLGTSVKYVFGENVEEVNSDVYASWLSVGDDGQIAVSEDGAQDFIDSLDYNYWIFKTKEEAEAKNKAMTAYLMDLTAEKAKIIQDIKDGKSETITPEAVTITPVPVQSTSSIDPSTGALTNSQGGSTYVLIDIASQSMFFWKDGQLIVSTPVTTGTSGLHDTPTGKYTLESKSANAVLRGTNSDGSSYASPVSFWMPFNGDIGIHDSSWRANYGGSIYLTSGSHGCVNTPYDAAAVIYNNITAGTVVIVQ